MHFTGLNRTRVTSIISDCEDHIFQIILFPTYKHINRFWLFLLSLTCTMKRQTFTRTVHHCMCQIRNLVVLHYHSDCYECMVFKDVFVVLTLYAFQILGLCCLTLAIETSAGYNMFSCRHTKTWVKRMLFWYGNIVTCIREYSYM